MAKQSTRVYSLIVTALGVIGIAMIYYFVLTAPAPEAEALSETTNEAAVEIDVRAALSTRILGDKDAPVKISEHSSLTCGHCGNFHQTTFKQLKEGFIDTGKAYLVFSDFPLNGPALHASMIARCLPEDKYFDFIQNLFEDQEKWAYSRAYLTFLKKKAAENGMNAATFKACIENAELEQGLVKLRAMAQTQWNISSTPSFVVNNKTVLSGGRSFEEFEKIINEELAKIETGGSD